MTRSTVLATVSLLRHFHRIGKTQGPRGLALYLKACSIYTMRFAAGNALHNSFEFGTSVSLTGDGLPRILPQAWRRSLRSGSPVIIRCALTVFGLYRVLDFPGPLKISTITDPMTGVVSGGIRAYAARFAKRWLPEFSSTKFKWESIPLLSKGAHVSNDVFSAAAAKLFPKKGWTSQGALFSALVAVRPYLDPLRRLSSAMGLAKQFDALRMLYDELSNMVFPVGRDFVWLGKPIDPDLEGELPVFMTKPFAPAGRLATKDEPGKVRVFAMVDAVTQWFLYPLHKRLFEWLKGIPTDATFDQRGAVETASSKIHANTKVYSFDLSAATDRLPVSLQEAILEAWCPSLGTAWRQLLVGRPYGLPKRAQKGRGAFAYYAVGQPMGAYSSWAMLAVTHHLIVQYAASVAYGKEAVVWFQDYMVLGDDIIIWDERVAKAYLAEMLRLGVNISPSKSLSSPKGAFEFAKRFVVAGVDCTPIPLAAAAASSSNLAVLAELLKMLPMRSISIIMRFLGFGYRVLGGLGKIPSSPSRRAFAVYWALQPNVCCQSLAKWSDWFITDGLGIELNSNVNWFEILNALAISFEKQRPKPPAEIQFFFCQAYLAELAGSYGGRDSFFPQVPTIGCPPVEAALAQLFLDSYITMFCDARERAEELENLFNSWPVVIGPDGVDFVINSCAEFSPISSLLSTGKKQSPDWREFVEPEEERPISVGSWIQLRFKIRSNQKAFK